MPRVITSLAVKYANIGFPLSIRGVDKATSRLQVAKILEQSPARLFLNTAVSKLSGGQAQLVSILRGFIASQPLIVCDEPFSAIDYPARIMLRSLILEKCRRQDIASLFVSHSIVDVVYLADRILVMSGRPAAISDAIYIPQEPKSDSNWPDTEPPVKFQRLVRAALSSNF